MTRRVAWAWWFAASLTSSVTAAAGEDAAAPPTPATEPVPSPPPPKSKQARRARIPAPTLSGFVQVYYRKRVERSGDGVVARTDPCRGLPVLRRRAPRLHYLRFADEGERRELGEARRRQIDPFSLLVQRVRTSPEPPRRRQGS